VTGHPDVVVVGAGVVGASVAFHLARGGASVTLVDRGSAGGGMSGRSSALVRTHYAFAPEVELAVRSTRLFEAWPDLLGRPPVVRRTGFVRIVKPGEEDHLRRNVEVQQRLGAKVELVEGSELAALVPGLRVDDVAIAAYEPEGGFGDGTVVAGDLVAAAREHGARVLLGCAVTGLLAARRRITGVATPGGAIGAGMVVVATNVWSPPLLRTVEVEVPITVRLHRVAHLRHQPGSGARTAVIDSVTGTYFRPEGSDDRTLVGDDFSEAGEVDPDALPTSGAAEEVADVVEAASWRLPALASAGIVGATLGALDMTPDGHPLLGAVPEPEGLVLAVGLSGTGFKVSPAIGEAIAAEILGRRDGAVDIRPFRPERFAEGCPIRSPFPYSDEP
jgi:sarcosine oxidase subunit beta